MVHKQTSTFSGFRQDYLIDVIRNWQAGMHSWDR